MINIFFLRSYSYEERIFSEGTETTIKIASVNRKDTSLFTCVAQNAFGRDETNFQIVVQGMYFLNFFTCVFLLFVSNVINIPVQ